MDQQPLLDIISRFDQARILVVGDMMLDRFIWGKVSRISPEAPVPVVQVARETAILGGAANVVCNIHALGGQAMPLGFVGADPTAAEIRRLFGEKQIDTAGILTGEDFLSIQKTRIVAHQQQVCRVDREGKPVLSVPNRALLEQALRKHLAHTDAVIVSDYGKGVIYPEMLGLMTGRDSGTYVSVDPKDVNFGNYHRVDVLTPNHNEAERMSGIAIEDRASLMAAATKIFDTLACRHLLITLGEHGMALFPAKQELVRIPTRAREVYDVSGAGDTVIATYTLAKAAGASPRQAAWLANAAAGVVVGKLGTATLSADELRQALGHTDAEPVSDMFGF